MTGMTNTIDVIPRRDSVEHGPEGAWGEIPVPRVMGYIYTGVTMEDTERPCGDDLPVVTGVLGRIHHDGEFEGMAELWSQEAHLGFVVSMCPVWTLEPVRPLHAIRQPGNASEHEDLVARVSRHLGRRMSEHLSDTEDLRRIARLCDYLADLIDLTPSCPNAGRAAGDACTDSVSSAYRAVDETADAEREAQP